MKVIVFSTTGCGICHMLMQWLDQQSVAYENVIVDESDEAMAIFMAVNDGAIGAPFTTIEEEDGAVIKIAGFNKAEFQAVLP